MAIPSELKGLELDSSPQAVGETSGQGFDLIGLEIEGLEISDFLDEFLIEQSEVVSKVMAASCTTCECCCSCCLLIEEPFPGDGPGGGPIIA